MRLQKSGRLKRLVRHSNTGYKVCNKHCSNYNTDSQENSQKKWLPHHRSSVFVVRHLQPQPDAHSVSVSNQSFICWVWPPCPQVTHNAAGPLTPDRHRAHFSFCRLQLAHHESWYASKQVPQVNERADSSWFGCEADVFNNSKRSSKNPQLYRISPYCVL